MCLMVHVFNGSCVSWFMCLMVHVFNAVSGETRSFYNNLDPIHKSKEQGFIFVGSDTVSKCYFFYIISKYNCCFIYII